MSRGGFTDPKQVIVARRDLRMPSGKLAAQVAHASVKVFLDIGKWGEDYIGNNVFSLLPSSDAMEYWMRESFPKAVLGVDSEMEIEILYAEAQRAGLPCSKIIDTGRTVYNGDHNLTCIAIGPAERSEIDKITGHLPLYKGIGMSEFELRQLFESKARSKGYQDFGRRGNLYNVSDLNLMYEGFLFAIGCNS